jgi:hypothetical protein
MLRLVLAVLVVALLVPVPPSAALRKPLPLLRVRTTQPFTVSGWHFAPREHVTIVVRLHGRYVRRAVASRTGRFEVVLRAVVYDRCSGYLVVATGDRGSWARVRLVAECTPLVPAPR